MIEGQYLLEPNVRLDARRAVWFSTPRMLVVADLHLGYSWAHRSNGQLLPLPATDDTAERLLGLQATYQPDEIILLGDVVHRPLAIEALTQEINRLLTALTRTSRVVIVTGNHDGDLANFLKPLPKQVKLVSEKSLAGHHFVHGHDARQDPLDSSAREQPGALRTVMGHEHPSICLGDGLATSVRCPCFLVSEKVIVLPAFSSWAAGCVVGRYPFMSTLAQNAQFRLAVAIMGERLLPIPLPWDTTENRAGSVQGV